MLSFFKKAKKKGKDTVISGDQLFGQEGTTSQHANVKPTLYFHPSWGEVAIEHKYIYQFLHKDLPSLKENQISLSGIDVEKRDGAYHVAAFLRNTISKPINFEKVALLLFNNEEQLCARKTFDLSALGNIPANTNMPWVFQFEEETITEAPLSQTDWQLAFDLGELHRFELDPTWEQQLSKESKDELRDFAEGLTPPAEDEINFLGLQATHQENGDLNVTILIRNGFSHSIELEQLPLQILDASEEVIAKGAFTLPNLEIKANTTKPWAFVFPASSVLKKEVNVTTWSIVVPQG